MQSMVKLRDMQVADLPLIMAWRSNPVIFEKGCYTQKEPLTWEEHITWFISRGKWWRFFIIVLDGRDVGVVNFGQLDNWNPEFNYYLGEVSLWGNGIGKEALQLGLDWLKRHGFCKTHTTIKNINDRSINVMLSLGAKKLEEARPGETRWEIILSNKDNASEYTSGRKPFMGISE